MVGHAGDRTDEDIREVALTAWRAGMDRILEELGAAAYVYGDSSVFHVYMAENGRRAPDRAGSGTAPHSGC